ncbi:hypothetical protein RO3G_10750 [Lichtheimia corymbifera JMRC:FSU:9682]|uniref:Ph domain-containing protein n=1 Tax=Lichtheimia corymbifera JMRC:FSU:9682 TaxID=1263082 RepID=A0A068SG76_9FUNG|nr:hypothetical protein RO3G_10750 [Lichtheimia corymbifera JMRC:FSU:9682]
MNKDALIKYGVQQVLAPYRPKAPGSELQKQTVIEMEASQQKKRYFWQRKPDPLDYLTPHERAVLKKVKKQARWLDKGIGCCCCQVGVDPIIGLIPVIGDFAGMLLALYLVQIAMQVDLPQPVVSQMMTNVVLDFLVGLVPIVGDLMDIAFKCNTRNAVLLENHLYKRIQQRQQEQRRQHLDPNEPSSSATTSSPPTEPLLQASTSNTTPAKPSTSVSGKK